MAAQINHAAGVAPILQLMRGEKRAMFYQDGENVFDRSPSFPARSQFAGKSRRRAARRVRRHLGNSERLRELGRRAASHPDGRFALLYPVQDTDTGVVAGLPNVLVRLKPYAVIKENGDDDVPQGRRGEPRGAVGRIIQSSRSGSLRNGATPICGFTINRKRPGEAGASCFQRGAQVFPIAISSKALPEKVSEGIR